MIEVVAVGLNFPESPFWSEQDGRLYFVEWTGDRVRSLGLDGLRTVFTTGTGSGPSGMIQDRSGKLWICLYSLGLLACYDPQGHLEKSISAGQDTPFKCPCDITIDPAGRIYFTDSGNFEEDWRTGQPAGAVYYLGPGDQLQQVDANLCYPNGIAASPRGHRLYIAEHRQNRILQYQILPDGSLSDKRVFFSMDDQCLLEPSQAFELGPDGLCVDPAGCLWIAHYGGAKVVQVSPEGHLKDIIHLPAGRKVSNVTYHPVEKALYITEAELGLLYRVAVE